VEPRVFPSKDGSQLALLRHQHSTRVRPQCVVNQRQSVAASEPTGACTSINSVHTTPQAGEVGPESVVYRTGLGTGVFRLGSPRVPALSQLGLKRADRALSNGLYFAGALGARQELGHVLVLGSVVRPSFRSVAFQR
jgi:hypothetical protein